MFRTDSRADSAGSTPSLVTGDLAAAGEAVGEDLRKLPGEYRLHRLPRCDRRRIQRRSRHPRSSPVGSDQARRQRRPTRQARKCRRIEPGRSLPCPVHRSWWQPCQCCARCQGALRRLRDAGTNNLMASLTRMDNPQRPRPRSQMSGWRMNWSASGGSTPRPRGAQSEPHRRSITR